jgi:hypothetical protein
MLIIGAVARDLIQARMKGKKGEKESSEENDEQEE